MLGYIEESILKRLHRLAEKYSFPDEEATSPDARASSALVADMSHPDTKVRRDAAFALGDLGDPRAILPLAEAYYAHERREEYLIYEQPEDVQLAIAMALFRLGESEEFVNVLMSESGYLRRKTAAALEKMERDRVVDVLIDALNEGDSRLAYWVTRALGELGDKRAVEPLIELLNHRFINVRTAAADSLGQLEDERALEALEHVRRENHEKNWRGRTASQAAAMAIEKIRQSKGAASNGSGPAPRRQLTPPLADPPH